MNSRCSPQRISDCQLTDRRLPRHPVKSLEYNHHLNDAECMESYKASKTQLLGNFNADQRGETFRTRLAGSPDCARTLFNSFARSARLPLARPRYDFNGPVPSLLFPSRSLDYAFWRGGSFSLARALRQRHSVHRQPHSSGEGSR
jgi:hypothetical protein